MFAGEFSYRKESQAGLRLFMYNIGETECVVCGMSWLLLVLVQPDSQVRSFTDFRSRFLPPGSLQRHICHKLIISVSNQVAPRG